MLRNGALWRISFGKKQPVPRKPFPSKEDGREAIQTLNVFL
jgi:hypothetical protein